MRLQRYYNYHYLYLNKLSAIYSQHCYIVVIYRIVCVVGIIILYDVCMSSGAVTEAAHHDYGNICVCAMCVYTGTAKCITIYYYIG